jgi:hypothetical protein
MKKLFIVISIVLTSLFATYNPTNAHGGGLDGSGGHNCYVGSCAGTYHYHRNYNYNNYVPVAPCLNDDNVYTISGFKHLQLNLKLMGFYSGPIDGIWGPQSRKAIIKARNLGLDTEGNLYIKCSKPYIIPRPTPSNRSLPYPGYMDNIDQDCSDIRRKVWVGSYDPDRLDADGDGWGCESYGG